MIRKSKTSKFVAAVVGGAMALALVVGVAAPTANATALTSTQISAIISLLQSFGADPGTIANVQASLEGQPTTTTTTTMSTGFTFNNNLSMGMTSPDVMQLQKVLNENAATQVAASGAGSPGNESDYFGALTKAAVIAFQNLHGIVPDSGFVGPITRGVLNSLNTTTTTTGTTTTTTTTTGSTTAGTVTVSAGTQPANSLAPQGASRVPFTTFTLTAGASDVTLTGVDITRVGLGSDAVFAGIVLLDSNGNQIGNSQTLNSNHQATIGATTIIPAGTSMTFTVAGNMQANLAAYAGQVVGVSVTGIEASGATVVGLPTAGITGAYQTINASLTLGSANVSVSSFDPNGSTGTQTSESIGSTAVRFAGVRIQAGSAENVWLKSIRWNQTGSAGATDLANLVTYVNGVAYPTTVDSSGKYFTSNFGTGILIDEGLSVDAYIQGDIVGSDAAGRTVQFSVYKNTDINLVGATYGYGIIPVPQTTNTLGAIGDGSGFTTGTPFFNGTTFIISGGTVTTVTKSVNPLAAAQNIAVNVPNQPLGGFDINVKGEPITVQQMTFHIATSTATLGSSPMITNISLVNAANGSVVAGPNNAVLASPFNGTESVTFTNTVTIPTGPSTYLLEGQLPSTAQNGAVITISTNPSVDWSNITGETSGNSISLAGNTNFSMNQMTVQAASLTISMAATPASQTIVAGGTQVLAGIQLDATQSGEDVQLSSLPVFLTLGAGASASNLSNCQLTNNGTPLNTNNIPTIVGGSNNTFSFDSVLDVPKGTLVTLNLQCTVAGGSTGTYQFGVTSAPTVTGATSRNSVVASIPGSNTGPVMTLSAGGTLSLSLDPSSPRYNIVAGGSSNVLLGAYSVSATNENINLTKLGLTLTSGSAADLLGSQVTLWNAATNTQIGTATFGSTNAATSTLSTPLLVTTAGPQTILVKGTLSLVGTGQAGIPGDLIKVNYNAADPTATEGTGVSSGATIPHSVTDSTTAVQGVTIQRSYPTITYGTGGSTISNGGTATLATVSISAAASGKVQLNKLTFAVSTSSVALSNFHFLGPNGEVSTSSPYLNAAGNALTVNFNSVTNTQDKVVAAGSTNVYTLQATVTYTGVGSTVSGSASVALEGDNTLLTANQSVSTLSADNIIWSPFSTTTASVVPTTTNDWSDGYGLPGCLNANIGGNCTTPSTVSVQ